MKRVVLVSLSAEDVLGLAKRYFSGAESGYSGTIVEEGEGYVRFETFRGHLAVAASRDGDSTRVRCSTLRYHPSIGKFLALLETASPVESG